MNGEWVRHLGVALVLIFAIGCSTSDSPSTISTELPSPALGGSGEPNLMTGDDGVIYMTWIEPTDNDQHLLRYSTLDSDEWVAPISIAQGEDWFVNWADFPTMVRYADGKLAAHWLAKNGEDPYAYDILISLSSEGGTKWSHGLPIHHDKTETQHGFVSMIPWVDDRIFAVWLDGRESAGMGHGHDGEGEETEGPMTLRGAVIDSRGAVLEETLLDSRVCSCCQTSAVRTANGAVLAYRDRSDNEIRDISIVRFAGHGWQDPQVLHGDGWNIAGCPVNGPSLDAEGTNVVAGWFTSADETPRVKVSFSDNEGETFGPPVIVDDGDPMGRIDVVFLENGDALACWMEATEDGAEIRARHINRDGTRGESVTVTQSANERAAGFPQMALDGDRVIFAWTQPGEPSQVRTAAVSLKVF